MSSEARVVRPYVGLEPFQKILDGWRVRVGAATTEPGFRTTVSSSSYLNDPFVLVCCDDDDVDDLVKDVQSAVEGLGLEPHDVRLVVVASTPYLRLSDVLVETRLDGEGSLPAKRVLDRATARALRTPNGGCDIEVAFVLADERPAEPLRPRRRATWLGRVVFPVRTELGEIGFTPRPLDDDLRKSLDLPAGAVRYVRVDADGLLEDDPDAVELFVDQHVLSQLNLSPGTAGGRTFQRQLFIDVLGAIVRATSSISGFKAMQWTDVEQSILGRVILVVAKGESGDSDTDRIARREAALKRLKKDPERFLALIEDAIPELRDDLRTSIGGGE